MDWNGGHEIPAGKACLRETRWKAARYSGNLRPHCTAHKKIQTNSLHRVCLKSRR